MGIVPKKQATIYITPTAMATVESIDGHRLSGIYDRFSATNL
jgi:hypothetical protein